jgi:hypothetical protein
VAYQSPRTVVVGSSGAAASVGGTRSRNFVVPWVTNTRKASHPTSSRMLVPAQIGDHWEDLVILSLTRASWDPKLAARLTGRGPSTR